MKLVNCRRNNCTVTVYTALFYWRWQEWDGLDFEKFSLIEKFSLNCLQFSDPSLLKAKPKMYHGLLFLQKIDWCLSPKFRGNVFPSGTSEKEGFLYGFDRKTAKVPWQCSIIREGIYGRYNFFSSEKRSSVEEDRRWYFPISNPHTQSLSLSGNTSASGKYSLLGNGEFLILTGKKHNKFLFFQRRAVIQHNEKKKKLNERH